MLASHQVIDATHARAHEDERLPRTAKPHSVRAHRQMNDGKNDGKSIKSAANQALTVLRYWSDAFESGSGVDFVAAPREVLNACQRSFV